MHSLRLAFVGALLAMGTWLAASPLPSTGFHFTASEVHGYADLDGNGQPDAIIIDRRTGVVRAGFSSGINPLQWSAPRAAGLYDVSGVTAGRLETTARDSLALTSPLTNRIFYFRQESATALPATQSISPTAVGPVSLAAGQIHGTTSVEDLILLSDRNTGANLYRADLLTLGTNGAISATTTRQNSSLPLRQATRVLLVATTAHQVAYLSEGASSASIRVLSLNQTGSPELLNVTGISPGSQFLLHPFGGSLAELVTWIPGATSYTVRPINVTGGVYSALAPVTMSVPFPIGQVMGIPSGTTARLLLISADGTTAAIRNTPTTASTQTFSPAEGMVFVGGLPLSGGDGRFYLLSGTAPEGRSLLSREYSFQTSTGTYQHTGDAQLATVHDTSGAGHVLAYAGEPFVAPNARVLRRLRSGDWSSSPQLGGQIQVTAETYTGPSSGLGNPATTQLGSPPATATHLLTSQYHPSISVFALRAAEGNTRSEVTIFPTPGIYPSSVQITLRGPSLHTLWYRTSTDQTWQQYQKPFWIHRSATVEAFASFINRTSILRANYTIQGEPGQLSTLGDGIPDYVKIGRNYNPTQLPDRDGLINAEGSYNYLQILLEGSGLSSRLLSGTAIDLYVRPLSHNGLNAADIPAFIAGAPLPNGEISPGVAVEVRDVSGELLDTSVGEDWGYFGVPQTAAYLTSVGRSGRASLTVLGTSQHFPIYLIPPYDAGTAFQGKEIVSLLGLPAANLPRYERTYTGGSDAAEAAAWVSGATAFYSSLEVPELGVTIDPLETTLLLVFEQWATTQLVARGVLPANYNLPAGPGPVPANRLTLTPFRQSESALPLPLNGTAPGGLILLTPEQFSQLEDYRSPQDPGYEVTEVLEDLRIALRTSADPGIAALRAVTLDIYRIAARWGGVFPGAFGSPVDALRSFLYTGTPPAAYTNQWEEGLPPEIGGSLTSLGPTDYAAARTGLTLLRQLPAQRPVATWELRVPTGPQTSGCTILERTDSTVLVALVNSEGQPFQFPATFAMIPGIILNVTGYTDRPAGPCAPLTMEVAKLGENFQAILTHVPLPGQFDSDSNLLPDDWELLFLGGTGNSPWSIPNNDGYTLLQIYLSGGDPLKPFTYNSLPPLLLAPPIVQVEPWTGDSLRLTWEFPAQFAGLLDFVLESSTSVRSGWVDTEAVPQHLGENRFHMVVPEPPENSPRFWRLLLRVR